MRCASASSACHHTALTSATRRLTYAELDQRSNRLANALRGMGLAHADRVGIYLPHCSEVVELELACYKAASIKAPFNARLSPTEVGEIDANSGAAVIVTTAERAEAFRPHSQGAMPRLLLLDGPADSSYEAALAQAGDAFTVERVTADEVAVLHYTSGSSGVLKAAMQTFCNRLAQLRKFLMRPDGVRSGRARQAPGKLDYASGGVGTPSHLGVELLLSTVNVQATHVPYKGASEIVNAVMGRQVAFGAPIFSVAYANIQAGKLRALAGAGPRRNPKLPQVPTLAELGVDGLELMSWGGVSVPVGTPEPIVGRMRAAFGKALRQPAVIAALEEQGGHVAALDAESYRQAFTKEVGLTAAMMKKVGLEPM